MQDAYCDRSASNSTPVTEQGTLPGNPSAEHLVTTCQPASMRRSREQALERLRALRTPLPKGLSFDRDVANARCAVL